MLDGSRLVQRGTHAELIAQKVLYRQFWHEREQAKHGKLGAGAPTPGATD